MCVKWGGWETTGLNLGNFQTIRKATNYKTKAQTKACGKPTMLWLLRERCVDLGRGIVKEVNCWNESRRSGAPTGALWKVGGPHWGSHRSQSQPPPPKKNSRGSPSTVPLFGLCILLRERGVELGRGIVAVMTCWNKSFNEENRTET